jgi:hypothetical protein
MVTLDEVEKAVENAKEMLSECGIDLEVTADQLWEYFETDLPVPDIELGDVIVNPFLVVHELVEIDEIVRMGLAITKDVVMKHPDEIDRAHLKAARVELMVAKACAAEEHTRALVGAIERWCVDEAVTQSRREEYRKLLSEAREALLLLASARE